ncbi:MAG: type II toxin-antitoxin system HicA family toxin [Dehalococcoidia bacterium]|nr:type II toxin-antitoxin system HicA family toxin [Dehalococcoidia bacterium]
MSPKLPRITAQELLRALQRDGWVIDRQRGSHVQLWNPAKEGLVTVAYHPGKIIKLKTLASVLKQAGWTVEDLGRLL